MGNPVDVTFSARMRWRLPPATKRNSTVVMVITNTRHPSPIPIRLCRGIVSRYSNLVASIGSNDVRVSIAECRENEFTFFQQNCHILPLAVTSYIFHILQHPPRSSSQKQTQNHETHPLANRFGISPDWPVVNTGCTYSTTTHHEPYYPAPIQRHNDEPNFNQLYLHRHQR